MKSLAITKSDGYTVEGVLLTVCPVERRQSGKDFEVDLAGNGESSVTYVIVDGERLRPGKASAKAPKPSGSGPRVEGHGRSSP